MREPTEGTGGEPLQKVSCRDEVRKLASRTKTGQLSPGSWQPHATRPGVRLCAARPTNQAGLTPPLLGWDGNGWHAAAA